MTDAAMLGSSGYERRLGDFYATEPWVTQALLDRVRFRGVVWEPACGRGDMAAILREGGYPVVESDIAGSDLGCGRAGRVDFLSPTATKGIDPLAALSIITNPPYLLAEQFLHRALEITEPGRGMVAMLFRNEYDCAASRRALFERPAFRAKLVLTKRPRWVEGPQKAAPRHNFSWFVFDHQHAGPAEIIYGPRR